MIYRSKTEIISVILRTAVTGAGKTKIMYDAYLSYMLVTKYIDFLMENGMLVNDKKMRIYKITEKGKRFLRMQDEINKMLSSQINNTHRSSTNMS